MKFAPFLAAAICLILSCPASAAKKPSPSQKIDQLVKAALEKQNIAPNGEISDDVFLRRVYLNIAGRIPTLQESETFLEDSAADKRNQLIETLLQSEAHVSHAFHFWADLLRLGGGNLGRNSALGSAYHLWIKEAIRSNMPYDEIVYSLVTAEGKFWDNGAVGYYFRDRGMPLDNMSNTVRIFLGTRLECAQCHNHPFDKWTQMDYFKMASFSFGMNTKNYDAPNREMYSKFAKRAGQDTYMAKAKELTGSDLFPYFQSEESLNRYLKKTAEKTAQPDEGSDEEKPAKPRRARKRRGRVQLTKHESLGLTRDEFAKIARQCIEAGAEGKVNPAAAREVLGSLYNPLQYLSVSATEKNSKLPHDYQYEDGDPHQSIEPETMFGGDAADATSENRIKSYGKWMTSPENPTFTKVIVNRMWKEVFGLGIFEPVDELTDHTFYANPELLAYLEKLMVDLDYNLREFQKVLYQTKTYQRASFTGELPLGTPYYFQGPILRRMSAEQIWDSLVALALPEADRYQPRLKSMVGSIEKVKRIYRSLEERPFEEYVKMVEELAPLIQQRRDRENELRAQLAEAGENGEESKYRKLRTELSRSKKEVERKISNVAYIYLKERTSSDDLLLAMGVMTGGPGAMTGDETEGQRVVMTKLPGTARKSMQRRGGKKLKGPEGRKEMNDQRFDYSVYRKLIANMARASELASPAPRGHFLRDFGQSDREVIENASDHASVPQALNLLNSTIVESLTNRFSVFGKRLHGAGSVDEKAEMIFQGMLTRQPTEAELSMVQDEVAQKGDDAYEGIVWALLNTRQFLFVQ